MTDEALPPPKWGTWGAFMLHAEQFDVTIESIENIEIHDGVIGCAVYLCRSVGARRLVLPLPEGFDRDRRLGLIKMENACRRLEIPEPTSWPPLM